MRVTSVCCWLTASWPYAWRARKALKLLKLREASGTQSSWVVSITHTPPPTGHAATSQVQLYWQELHRAHMEKDFLVLDNDACFGGKAHWGSRIYLRPIYCTLWARIKELVAQGCGQILVTGDRQEQSL
jgi:hypothetical protein